MMHIQKRIS